MHIEHITIENFLGVRHLDAAVNAPGVTLIAGHNGAGKSTVGDALRFALLGEPGRVRLKKEYWALLSEGARDGHVTVVMDGDREVRRNVKTGNTTGSAPDMPETLGPVLDADRFVSMDPKGRRRLLMDLASVSVSRDEVRSRLLDHHCDPDKVDAILPMLRQGFEAAAGEAAGRAREAKGAWRQITGENWGKAKAEDWRADPRPHLDIVSPSAIETLRKDRAEAAQALAELEAAIRMQERARDLGAGAGDLTRLESELSAAVDAASFWQAEVDRYAELARSGGGLLTWFDCPDCGTRHRVRVSQGEITMVPEEVDDPTAEHELAHARKELKKASAVVADLNRRMEAARAAAGVLDDICPTQDPKADAEALRDDISTLDAQINSAEATQEDLRKTAEARRLHEEVMAWLAIADALGPDGIPAELTAETIAPTNRLLRDLAGDTGWAQPMIGPDMEITVGGRPYGLLSESEQWRTDAMIAAAIAIQSDLRLFVLDRMDVLDIPSRNACLRWLSRLASERRFQVIVMATLKARPERLMPGVACIWLEHGTATDARRAA